DLADGLDLVGSRERRVGDQRGGDERPGAVGLGGGDSTLSSWMETVSVAPKPAPVTVTLAPGGPTAGFTVMDADAAEAEGPASMAGPNMANATTRRNGRESKTRCMAAPPLCARTGPRHLAPMTRRAPPPSGARRGRQDGTATSGPPGRSGSG